VLRLLVIYHILLRLLYTGRSRRPKKLISRNTATFFCTLIASAVFPHFLTNITCLKQVHGIWNVLVSEDESKSSQRQCELIWFDLFVVIRATYCNRSYRRGSFWNVSTQFRLLLQWVSLTIIINNNDNNKHNNHNKVYLAYLLT